MKTETQIAQENIEEWKVLLDRCKARNIFRVKANRLDIFMQSHKATCQRFLEFLENYKLQTKSKLKIVAKKIAENSNDGGVGFILSMLGEKEAKIRIIDKITDLKQASKLYNKVGI